MGKVMVVGVAATLALSCGRGSLDQSSSIVPIAPFADACPPVGTPGTLTKVRPTGSSAPPLLGTFGPCRLLLAPGASSGSMAPLWLSDGTPAGTGPILDDFDWGPDYRMIGHAAVFGTMWRTDGTRAGSYRLADRLVIAGNANSLADTARLGDLLLFTGSGDDYTDAGARYGYQVWRTDGTRAGTSMITETPSGSPSLLTGPGGYVALGNAILFADSQGDLWRTDGTAPGTERIAPLRKRAAAVLRDALLFVGGPHDANGTITSVGLWRTDGTAAGTSLLHDLGAPDSQHASFYVGSDNFALTALGDQMIVMASPGRPDVSPESGTTWPPGPPIDAVWVTDGTAAGTRLLVELPEHERFNTTFQPFVLNGAVLFVSSGGGEPPDYYGLWRTDGTTAGTLRLAPFSPLLTRAIAGSNVFFAGATVGAGAELWVSDGTSANTHLVKDINPGPGSALGATGSPRYATAIGNRIVFEAYEDAHGSEPWVSDGTEAGTGLIADINPGNPGSASSPPVEMNGAVYFTAASAPGAFALWRFVPSQP